MLLMHTRLRNVHLGYPPSITFLLILIIRLIVVFIKGMLTKPSSFITNKKRNRQSEA